ncbi:hypothetical protein [Microvirga lotononidis]|uniref:Uncharacterized protein n=1 Tax=Microvirga lotononidis TaxID=864069 RepID=I4Z2C0_9HYPH|nr:hypothetical protein [Microvirga lotononidis]EIM30362.1 hypothetical protein MicloDRAFT_00009120 [Microvirga lotononidis]WQO30859.1 hypothetical protein U0023_25960 [Microvirga lotononidis]
MISPPTRAFWTVICSGFGFVILTVMARASWDVFWIDVVQQNPNRSQAHALLLIPFLGIVVGLGIALVQLSGALVTAAAITAALVRRLGQAPIWTVPLLVPVCGLVIYGQDALLGYPFSLDGPDAFTPVHRTLMMFATLLPALIGSWCVLRYRAKRTSSSTLIA